MTDEIAEAIQKLEMYQQQIKEQTKKEILSFVENRGEDYFESIRKDAEDNEISQINYRLKTVTDIENMIDFLNVNYNPEFLKSVLRQLKQMPVTTLNGDVVKTE